MFDDNDSQLVVNLDYQLDKKELAFMITKTLFIRCYTIKYVRHCLYDVTLLNMIYVWTLCNTI